MDKPPTVPADKALDPSLILTRQEVLAYPHLSSLSKTEKRELGDYFIATCDTIPGTPGALSAIEHLKALVSPAGQKLSTKIKSALYLMFFADKPEAEKKFRAQLKAPIKPLPGCDARAKEIPGMMPIIMDCQYQEFKFREDYKNKLHEAGVALDEGRIKEGHALALGALEMVVAKIERNPFETQNLSFLEEALHNMAHVEFAFAQCGLTEVPPTDDAWAVTRFFRDRFGTTPAEKARENAKLCIKSNVVDNDFKKNPRPANGYDVWREKIQMLHVLGIYSGVLTKFRQPAVFSPGPLTFREDGTFTLAKELPTPMPVEPKPKVQPAPNSLPLPAEVTPVALPVDVTPVQAPPPVAPAPKPEVKPVQAPKPDKTDGTDGTDRPDKNEGAGALPKKNLIRPRAAEVKTFSPAGVSVPPIVGLGQSDIVLGGVNLRELVMNLAGRSAERGANREAGGSGGGMLAPAKVIETQNLSIELYKTPWAIIDVQPQTAALELPQILGRIAAKLKDEANNQNPKVRAEAFRLVVISQRAAQPIREALVAAARKVNESTGLAVSAINEFRPAFVLQDSIDGKKDAPEQLQGKIVIALLPETVIPANPGENYIDKGRLLIHHSSFLSALPKPLVVISDEVEVELVQ